MTKTKDLNSISESEMSDIGIQIDKLDTPDNQDLYIDINDVAGTNSEEITQLFNPADFEVSKNGYHKAMKALYDLASNQSMSDSDKFDFNRNFYSYLAGISNRFHLSVNLQTLVFEYMPTLENMTIKQRNSVSFVGDSTGYIFKLIDGNSRYGSAWNDGKAQFKFPSQWFHAFNIIQNNKAVLNSYRKAGQ